MASHPSFDLIPAPSTVLPGDQSFILPNPVTLSIDEPLSEAWAVAIDILSRRLGLVPSITPDEADLMLRLDPELAKGAYRLQVSPSIPHATPTPSGRVTLTAAGLEGTINGLRTLQQLIGEPAFRHAPAGAEVVVPEVFIEDTPRFQHRGVLLDVARNFLPKDQVMRFIDLASMHKLNVLQLHLTDDQGWRMEVRAFPRLTEVGSWRTESQVGSSRSTLYDGQPHGGYYTQDDLREIVAFARSRGITVVPEIDVPGHSQAAMAAYPELSAAGLTLPVWTSWGLNRNALDTSEFVLDFYRTVLDELMEIFDSTIICIGGDEVDTEQWAKNDRIVRQAADLGLEDVDELLPWFSAKLADHIRERGRRASVWDEVGGSRVPRDIIVNSWRGYRGGLDAMRDGHDIVVSRSTKCFSITEPPPASTSRRPSARCTPWRRSTTSNRSPTRSPRPRRSPAPARCWARPRCGGSSWRMPVAPTTPPIPGCAPSRRWCGPRGRIATGRTSIPASKPISGVWTPRVWSTGRWMDPSPGSAAPECPATR